MALADFNADGTLDVLLGNYRGQLSQIFLNRGNGAFEEIAGAAGDHFAKAEKNDPSKVPPPGSFSPPGGNVLESEPHAATTATHSSAR